jgi:hypothetical protein
MSIDQKELVKRWELTPGRISQLVKQGMPLSSIEDAEKWRAERHWETGIHPSGFEITPTSIEELLKKQPEGAETFENLIERQRELVILARQQYIQAVKDKSPQQSKLYASYDKTVSTLIELKAEMDRLSIMSRDYIRATDAGEAMKKFAADVVNRLDKLPLDCAESCNPDNPSKAVKVLEAWRNKARKELSND